METLDAETHFFRKLGVILLAFVMAFVTISSQLTASTVEASELGAEAKAFIDRIYPIIDRVADEVAEEKGLDQEGRALSKLVAMAQAIHETGHGRSWIYRNKHNLFGTGAYPTATETVNEHALAFASDEESIRYYFEHFADGYEGATSSFYAYHNPYDYIEHIAASYAEDGSYARKVSGLVDSIAVYLAEQEVVDAEQVTREAQEAQVRAKRELAVAKIRRDDAKAKAEEIARKATHTGPIAGICAEMSCMMDAAITMEEHGVDVVAAKVDVVAATKTARKAEKELAEAENYLSDSEAIQTVKVAVDYGRVGYDSLSDELKEAIASE